MSLLGKHKLTSSSSLPDTLMDHDALLNLLDSPDSIPLDLITLKSYVANLNKSILLNTKLRSDYSENPMKFMESEIKIDENIKILHELSTQPSLFADFVSLKGVTFLSSLLLHENIDISTEVLELLLELIEPDSYEEDKSAIILPITLCNISAFECIISRINTSETSLKEETLELEEREALELTLNNLYLLLIGIFEILPSNSNLELFTNPLFIKFTNWVIDNMIPNSTNSNLAAELFSLIASYISPSNLNWHRLFESMKYALNLNIKSKAGSEESEKHEEFIKYCLQGMQSMFIKQSIEFEDYSVLLDLLKREAFREEVLSCIDASLSTTPENSAFLIRSGALKILFGLFNKVKSLESQESLVSILTSFFFTLSGPEYTRFFAKFEENSGEKVENIVALYELRLRELEVSDLQAEDAESEDDKYFRRLDSGLLTSQKLSLVIAMLLTSQDNIAIKTKECYDQLDRKIDDLKNTLLLYSKDIGDANESLRDIIIKVIDML